MLDTHTDRILAAVPAWPATITPKEIADAEGIKPATVQGTLRRFDGDRTNHVRAVARGVYSRVPPGIDPVPLQLADGDAPDETDPPGADEADLVSYAAGDSTSRVRRIVRSRIEVETTTGYRADSLFPVFVEGESMAPLIQPNSFALALPMRRFDGPGIYAFELDGHRLVKHVDVLLGGILRISARNREAYPEPEELVPVPEADTENTYRSRTTGHTGTVRVHGRIVAFTQVT